MGRPRSFDAGKVLDVAMFLFWEHGYSATSVDNVSSQVGISKPSLYACFGNKERLFRLAVRRYETCYLGFYWRALKGKTSRDILSGVLLGYISHVTRGDAPHGCLGFNAAVNHTPLDAAALVVLRRRHRLYRRILKNRLATVISDDQGAVQAETLAQLAFIALGGISIQAKEGASHDALERSIRLLLDGLFA